MTTVTHSHDRISLDQSRSRLANLWFAGAGGVFVVLIIQSILGKYEGQLQEVWSWFVPTVVPTLALMLGVMGAAALKNEREKHTVKRSFFRLARTLSLFYLVVLMLIVLLEPFSATPGIKLYTLSNYWLTPIQGLVVAAIGVLFTSQEKHEVGNPPAPEL
jgi:cytochrome bd-type quinol oxidase subunit 2